MSQHIKGFHEILASLMPPDRMHEYSEQCRRQDEREAKLIADMRSECLNAMQCLVDATRSPRIAKQDITEALETLRRALKWAEELER
jgi:hypothetical protein